MKKQYSKPVINIENFEMDIDILASLTAAELDVVKKQFENMFGCGLNAAELEIAWADYRDRYLGQYDNEIGRASCRERV